MKDLIDRTKALEAIRAIDDHGDLDRANALGLAEWAVKGLPSAQPERKRGAWVGVGFYDEDCGHHLWYACDKCSYQTTWHMKPIFNFCPSCGADMRGEKNG